MQRTQESRELWPELYCIINNNNEPHSQAKIKPLLTKLHCNYNRPTVLYQSERERQKPRHQHSLKWRLEGMCISGLVSANRSQDTNPNKSHQTLIDLIIHIYCIIQHKVYAVFNKWWKSSAYNILYCNITSLNRKECFIIQSIQTHPQQTSRNSVLLLGQVKEKSAPFFVSELKQTLFYEISML